MPNWGFYGRKEELAEIDAILGRGRFFFCTISGRRRIGKTSLIQEALKRRGPIRAIYVQIPDSDERGVVQAFEDATEDVLQDQDIARRATRDLSGCADLLSAFWEAGAATIVDEFQYFHRSALREFQSHLQGEVDKARDNAAMTSGLFALGSIHTEMTALLESKDAPLFNRITDRLYLRHWDTATLFEMFREHGITDQHHRLFLWSMFEGVPKFYRDCFDQGVLTQDAGADQTPGLFGLLEPDADAYRKRTLRTMFFEGSSPLRDEADNWFLRELRGRYDSVLTILARSGPVSHGQLLAEYARTGAGGEKQIGGYLQALIDRYQMVVKEQPILSTDKQRNARYRIADNFLQAWLQGLLRHVRLARIRPLDEAVSRASDVLKVHEGVSFEKFVRQTMEECSRKQVGNFPLTDLVKGYWTQDIEIDLVAIDEQNRTLRLGSCKRSADKHRDSVASFDGHVARFLASTVARRFAGWEIQRALYAPTFSDEVRKSLTGDGYVCVDMGDFEGWLS